MPTIQNLIRDESGNSIVEQALLIALLLLACLGAITAIGQGSNNMLIRLNSQLIGLP